MIQPEIARIVLNFFATHSSRQEKSVPVDRSHEQRHPLEGIRVCFERSNPDKVMTRPYLGREAVSFSSILHDDLKGRTAAAG
jgi:hypothetical protein